jgi:ribosome biogenesis GTPase A
MLWPGIGQQVGLKLAATHSIGRNAYDNIEVAAALGAYLLEQYPALLTQRFGSLAETHDGHRLLEAIAHKRGFIVKAGAPDLERAARIFLGEFRDGTLGNITLEVPEDTAAGGDDGAA